MRLHFAGKYNGDESTLPAREHCAGYVPFKEPENMEKLSRSLMKVNLVMFAVLLIPYCIRAREVGFDLWGLILFLAALVPHEFLHALMFKEDVYMYSNLRQGMLFVAGCEDMTRGRFVMMSLLPNIVFGAVPFLLYMINPSWKALGTFGLLALPSGVGDYLNVYNALTQVPEGALIYMSGMHTFWHKT